jgi:hypothetical protein
MPPNAEVHGIGATLEIAFHADAATGVSYRDATGANTNCERHQRSPARRQACLATAIQKAPDRQRASALALHIDCSRVYIGKLEAEGVIQWLGASLPLDKSARYLPSILAARAAAIAAHASRR